MKFCPMCGARLVEGARFCSDCGESVPQSNNKTTKESRPPKREQTFEPNTCPYCGMVLNTLSPLCPACGRDVKGKGLNACQKFLDKLDEIEAEKNKILENTGWESFLSSVSNVVPLVDDPVEKKRRQNTMNAEERKMEYIRTFRVPNNKTDLVEFINLTESLADISDDDEIEELLRKKHEEAYQRALMLMPNDPDVLVIKKKKDDIEAEKKRREEERRLKYENSFAGRLQKKIMKSMDDFLEK